MMRVHDITVRFSNFKVRSIDRCYILSGLSKVSLHIKLSRLRINVSQDHFGIQLQIWLHHHIGILRMRMLQVGFLSPWLLTSRLACGSSRYCISDDDLRPAHHYRRLVYAPFLLQRMRLITEPIYIAYFKLRLLSLSRNSEIFGLLPVAKLWTLIERDICMRKRSSIYIFGLTSQK